VSSAISFVFLPPVTHFVAAKIYITVMKKALFFSSLMLLALISIQGCDAISSATSKDFVLNVVLPLDAGGTSTTITKVDTADLAALSTDFSQYKDHVTALSVDSAWWEVTSAPTPSDLVLVNGKYSIQAADGSGTPTLFAEVTNTNLMAAASMGKMPLDVKPGAGQKFADLLKNSPNKALVILNETLNKTGAYSIKLYFKMKMTASVL
jgi:hypothetical protein